MTVFETKIYSCIVIYLHKTVQLHIMRKKCIWSKTVCQKLAPLVA